MPPPLIRRATGQLETIKTKGPPLGILSGINYQSQRFPLHAGDTLLLMSDGLIERFNQDEEILGEEAVADTLAKATGSVDQVIERLVALGERHAGSRAQDDDTVLLVIRRTPSIATHPFSP
jgi:serine phosphatase RsbU (regulator of sigma subunit)